MLRPSPMQVCALMLYLALYNNLAYQIHVVLQCIHPEINTTVIFLIQIRSTNIYGKYKQTDMTYYIIIFVVVMLQLGAHAIFWHMLS